MLLNRAYLLIFIASIFIITTQGAPLICGLVGAVTKTVGGLLGGGGGYRRTESARDAKLREAAQHMMQTAEAIRNSPTPQPIVIQVSQNMDTSVSEENY